jgi:peroxiredoxin
MNRIFLALLFSLFVLNGFTQMRPGQSATNLTLPDLNGKMVSLSELRGKVVLIDFWASWCGPCRRNNPRLVKLYKKYHSRGLEIYGISLDENTDNWKKAVHQDRMDWIQVIDDKGWDASSANIYGVDMIPSSFLIDKSGTIQFINLEGSDLEQSVKDLLAG